MMTRKHSMMIRWVNARDWILDLTDNEKPDERSDLTAMLFE